jgi:hypothetical protein
MGETVRAPAAATAQGPRKSDQQDSSIGSEVNRPRTAKQACIRFWRSDGSADAATLAATNGAVAAQACRRRKTFARDVTALEFTEARAGRLTLSTCAGGRR